MEEFMLQDENYVHQAYTELNPLTGLYYNRAFFKKVEEYLQTIEPNTYSLAAIDIEHFRLFNKLYGRDGGDCLLIYIADCLKEFQATNGGVVGYLGGDNFGVFLPEGRGLLKQLQKQITQGIKRLHNTVGFLPAFGVYLIDDITVPAATMYDRATIALSHVLGNYAKRICEYDVSMEEKLEEELKLLSEVQIGLEKEEFTFYVQPQCDISTGKIVGGESLVRWKHSTKGMIPPGVFVPVLERNGFIADLDRYVWKKVCQWLRGWIDRGYHPVPISINVSRIDIFSMDVPAYLTELLNTYRLPAKLLKVEITESAYAESNDKIIRTVKQLRDADFLVMMDDFGSGYSSLNMLKSVAVDILKIDMRFLDIDEKEEEKGIGILESVVNMARQMRMPIVVEGVETQKQESFLLKMGCRYTQGYYYYRPLPIEDFEKIISDERNLDFSGIWCNQVESFHIREFLDSNLFNDTMVNNILGAAAFYDMYENQIEITRVNEQYYRLAGISDEQAKDYNKKFWNHVRDDDRYLLFSIFEQAYDNPVGGSQGYVHYIRDNGECLWVYMRVFFLREKDGHKLFYSALTDMTFMQKQKKADDFFGLAVDEMTEKQLKRMEEYYGDMPCGYGVAKIILNDAGKPCDYEIVYANHEMERICCNDIKRLRFLVLRVFDNDKEVMLDKTYRAAYLGETVEHYVYSAASGHYLQITLYQYQNGYASCMLRDITHTRILENAMASVASSYREVNFVQLQNNYSRMIYPDENHLMERVNYEEAVARHFATGKILPYDEENVRNFLSLNNLRKALKNRDTVEYKYRRSVNGVGEEWCLTSFSVSERENGDPQSAIMTIRSIESLVREETEQRRIHMAQTLASMSDGFFIYRAVGEEKILYANPAILKLFGCENMDEFREYVGGSFRGIVHPEDLKRVEWEIKEQVKYSERKMDYIRYRIIRKDGQVRWVDDCGHLDDTESGEENQLFYVFISDITDTITEAQKQRLLELNQQY